MAPEDKAGCYTGECSPDMGYMAPPYPEGYSGKIYDSYDTGHHGH